MLHSLQSQKLNLTNTNLKPILALNQSELDGTSLPFLISKTFLWEFECIQLTKVGLLAGLYSGNNRPDLNRTPHALQSVLGPIGPSLHCGVLFDKQWVHLLCAFSSFGTLFGTLTFFFGGGLGVSSFGWLNGYIGSLSANHSVRLGRSGGSSKRWMIPLLLLLNSDLDGEVEIGLGFRSGLTGTLSVFGPGCGWVQ